MGTANASAQEAQELPEITEIRKLVSELPLEIQRVGDLERTITGRGVAVIEEVLALVKPHLRYLTYPPDEEEPHLASFGPYAQLADADRNQAGGGIDRLLINRDAKLYIDRTLGKGGEAGVVVAIQEFGFEVVLHSFIELLSGKLNALAKQRANLTRRLHFLAEAEKAIGRS